MSDKVEIDGEKFGTRTRVGGSRTIGKDGKVTTNKVLPPRKRAADIVTKADNVTKDKDNAD